MADVRRGQMAAGGRRCGCFPCIFSTYLSVVLLVFLIARAYLTENGVRNDPGTVQDSRQHPAHRLFFARGRPQATSSAIGLPLSPVSAAGDALVSLSSPPPSTPRVVVHVDAPSTNDWVVTIQNEDTPSASLRPQRSLSSIELPPATFSAAWTAYKAMHAAKTSGAIGMRGVIMVRPVGQLGNRVMAVASSVVLGMLTNRAVYATFEPGYYASIDDLFATSGVAWDAMSAPGGGGSCTRSLSLAEPSTAATDLAYLLCEDDAATLPGADDTSDDGICITSNQYFAPLLARNPAYAARLASLFPRDGDMFGLIARELFQPSPTVAAMRDAFKSEVGWSSSYVVGLQLRTGGDFTDRGFAQHDWDLTLRVANALLPPGVPPSKTVFFVATDIEWSRDAALVQLGRNGTRVLEFGNFLRSNTPRGCQQAFVDILLLAESNDLVTTAWSTFGYMAAGLTGHRPAVITLLAEPPTALLPAHLELTTTGRATYMGVPMHDDRRTGAARLPTAEPCYHFITFNAASIAEATCYTHASELAGRPLLEAWMRGGRYC